MIFFDLRADELAVFTLDTGGSAGVCRGTFTTPVGPGYTFTIDLKPDIQGDTFLSLPLSMINFRIVELPFSDSKKIRELLPFEIDGLVLGGSESIVFDVRVLGELAGNAGKYRVLVTYVMKDILRAILNGFASAGFAPKVVTSVELAYILNSASGSDIAGQLIAPPDMTGEERIAAALEEIRNPTANFRRDEFAYTAETDRTKKSLRTTLLLAAVLLLVFVSDITMTAVSVTRENRSIRDEMRKIYTGIFPNEKKITSEEFQLKAHIKELRDKESSLVGTSPLQLLVDLAKISGPGTTMTEVTIEKELIVLKGECQSLSDVQKLKGGLDGFLNSVNISDTRPSSQNRTLFTITAKGRKV